MLLENCASERRDLKISFAGFGLCPNFLEEHHKTACVTLDVMAVFTVIPGRGTFGS